MKKFFVLLLLLFLAPATAWGAEAQDPQTAADAKYCDIGVAPLDARRKEYVREDEVVRAIPHDALVTMRTARGAATCTLRAGEKIVVGPGGMWVLACGNTILKGIQAEVFPQAAARDNGRSMDVLVALASRPVGTIQGVDGCGPECRSVRDQVRFNFNVGVGAGVYWHHGLKGTTMNQSQVQTQTAQGGQGGTGIGGQGGNGGDTTITVSPPIGPINPDPPLAGPGGPVNPNSGPANPNSP